MLSRAITCSYSIFCLPCWDPSRSTANPGILLLSQFSTVSSNHFLPKDNLMLYSRLWRGLSAAEAALCVLLASTWRWLGFKRP